MRGLRAYMAVMVLGWPAWCLPQTYTLSKSHDSLYFLNEWRLPYPVYRFQTGDVNGDGSDDALVGVVKSTRFHPEKGRRLFIFKTVEGKVRPLWLGSKLGGTLADFRFIAGKQGEKGTVRSLETTADGKYVVAEYEWQGFGLAFVRFLAKNTSRQEALQLLNR